MTKIKRIASREDLAEMLDECTWLDVRHTILCIKPKKGYRLSGPDESKTGPPRYFVVRDDE